MTVLRWSSDAEADIDNITDYIAERNPAAAVEIRDEIETRIKSLKMFPLG